MVASRASPLAGMRVDRAVGAEVIERLQPLGVEAALAAAEMRRIESAEKQRQVEFALEQARFEAARARRQRWRSRNRVGRPKVSAELRKLIAEMNRANPLWGALRIHGELLKLGFEVAQSTVARYMCRRSRPPSQGWRTFLRNHANGIAAVDLFVLPTIAFQILYCLVVLCHGRRLWVSFGVTANPTAEWISHQITEAFAWDGAPRYMGRSFMRRLRAMGIRDRANRTPITLAKCFMLSDSSARSDGSASTTASCSVRRTYAGS
jgi:hypothetical protein